MTFRKDPGRLEKALWISLFGALMVCEIWMIGKDRDQRDHDSQQLMTSVGIITATTTTDRSHVLNIEQNLLEAEKNNDRKAVARFQAELKAVKDKSAANARQSRIGMMQQVADNLEGLAERWYERVDAIKG